MTRVPDEEFRLRGADLAGRGDGPAAQAGRTARVLAGGTDLLVQLREHLRDADLVVDVKKIPELMELSYSPARGCRLGASVPCYRIYENPDVSRRLPGPGGRGADRGRLADPEPGERGREPLQFLARRPTRSRPDRPRAPGA